MYQHILVPTDGSPASERAAASAAALAHATGARLTALYAIAPIGTPMVLDAFPYESPASAEAYERRMREYADQALAKVQAAASAKGVTCDAISVIHGHPWEAIVDAAKAKGCDLIVMASHGRRGLEALILGSETTKVLTHANVPVLVCR
jgi:nucleotide-binding universal stress UspA family protein